jgi:hypothetical protein
MRANPQRYLIEPEDANHEPSRRSQQSVPFSASRSSSVNQIPNRSPLYSLWVNGRLRIQRAVNPKKSSRKSALEMSGALGLAVGTELWYMWGCIAIEQALQAKAARREWIRARTAGETWDMSLELRPAMLAIVGVVTSLDGFERRVKGTGLDVTPPPSERTKRHEWIWATLRTGFDVTNRSNDWPPAIKDLFALRNSAAGGLLHPTTVFAVGTEHPSGALDSAVSPSYAVFTTENADKAVAVMRDIYGTCLHSVRPEHQGLTHLVGFIHRGALKKLSVSDRHYEAWGNGGPDDLSRSD